MHQAEGGEEVPVLEGLVHEVLEGLEGGAIPPVVAVDVAPDVGAALGLGPLVIAVAELLED
eukprot:11375174-Alexandrium_andersonii.AAC.1